jgi:uncharacterized protein YlxW (UPF0749 family)
MNGPGKGRNAVPDDERGEHATTTTTASGAGERRSPGVRHLTRLLIGVLCAVLGFAVTAEVRSNDTSTKFATARQDELVGILGDLSQRSERLRGDIRDLENTKAGLERDTQGQTAVEDARRRAATYGMLAGTLPAAGPGIRLTIDDPRGRLRAEDLLDALEELRDAGAEVIQVDDVRVGVSTYLADAASGGVVADGRLLARPYRFLVIGDPHTLAAALGIPGGILQTLRNSGAQGKVAQEQKIIIRAIRSP